MTDAIIWDFNGTLLDDVKLSYDILNILLKRHGFAPVKTLEKYREIFGFPIIDYYERAGFNFNNVSFAQLADEYMQINLQWVNSCTLHKGAKETLQTVKALGIKQIVLSACERSALTQQLTALGIVNYFDEILGTENFLGEGKLEMGIAWEKKQNIKNAVMCGDTLHDLEVAHALSAKCVLFSQGHHSKKVLVQTGEAVIDQISELIKHI